MSEWIETTYYPFSDTIKSYTIRLIHEPIMVPLMELYRSSSLIEKLAKEASERNSNTTYDELIKAMRGVSLLAPGLIPEEYRLTHHFAEAVDDKINTITFVEREVISDLQAVADHVSSHGYQNIDLGELRWKLLIDIEALLLFCRSILDLFARLTKVLYKQIGSKQLPDSFAGQVKKYAKYQHVDTEYFNHIIGLDWFPKLKQYRDDLSHKASLNIIVEPSSEPYLRTSKKTTISFSEIIAIISGVKDFASYYVEHFSRILQGLSIKS